eukprot:TRINITY_DN2682_c2_g1_i2.p1 TRINITY_DN2682_c2_g1~~TRINITY_DN2682_c2_g1_i2.p1  ORF type:complete len:841 (-),score=135.46 TRINITY_DN2682_c2_g1_i2:130-2652(-)
MSMTSQYQMYKPPGRMPAMPGRAAHPASLSPAGLRGHSGPTSSSAAAAVGRPHQQMVHSHRHSQPNPHQHMQTRRTGDSCPAEVGGRKAYQPGHQPGSSLGLSSQSRQHQAGMGNGLAMQRLQSPASLQNRQKLQQEQLHRQQQQQQQQLQQQLHQQQQQQQLQLQQQMMKSFTPPQRESARATSSHVPTKPKPAKRQRRAPWPEGRTFSQESDPGFSDDEWMGTGISKGWLYSDHKEELLVASIAWVCLTIHENRNAPRRPFLDSKDDEGNSWVDMFDEAIYNGRPVTELNEVTQYLLGIFGQGDFEITEIIMCISMLRDFLSADFAFLFSVDRWRPLFMTCLLIADKLCVDQPVKTKDMRAIVAGGACGDVGLGALRGLPEGRFGLMEWKLGWWFCGGSYSPLATESPNRIRNIGMYSDRRFFKESANYLLDFHSANAKLSEQVHACIFCVDNLRDSSSYIWNVCYLQQDYALPPPPLPSPMQMTAGQGSQRPLDIDNNYKEFDQPLGNRAKAWNNERSTLNQRAGFHQGQAAPKDDDQYASPRRQMHKVAARGAGGSPRLSSTFNSNSDPTLGMPEQVKAPEQSLASAASHQLFSSSTSATTRLQELASRNDRQRRGNSQPNLVQSRVNALERRSSNGEQQPQQPQQTQQPLTPQRQQMLRGHNHSPRRPTTQLSAAQNQNSPSTSRTQEVSSRREAVARLDEDKLKRFEPQASQRPAADLRTSSAPYTSRQQANQDPRHSQMMQNGGISRPGQGSQYYNMAELSRRGQQTYAANRHTIPVHGGPGARPGVVHAAQAHHQAMSVPSRGFYTNGGVQYSASIRGERSASPAYPHGIGR